MAIRGTLTGDDGTVYDAVLIPRIIPNPADVEISVSASPSSPQPVDTPVTFTVNVSPVEAAGTVALTREGEQAPIAQVPVASGTATIPTVLQSSAGTVNYYVIFYADDPEQFETGVSAGPVVFEVTTPTPPPPAPDLIVFGSSGTRNRAVNGVDRDRGANETILYSPARGANTGTNRYGVEVEIRPVGTNGAWQVTRKENRTTTNGPAFTIPADGIVASFHGTSADWAVTNTNVGDPVTLKAAGVVTGWPVGNVPDPGGPPAVPALSGAAGNAQASLTWTAVPTATSYKVYRDGTMQATVADRTSFVDTGLTNGTAYAYRVSAVNAFGEGQQSNTVTLTPAEASTGTFLLGASGHGVASGELNAWQDNHAVRMVGIWSDTAQHDTWKFDELKTSLAGWSGPVDVAVGGLRPGQNWASAAAGAYNAEWEGRFRDLKAAWGSRPAGNLFVRIAHEFNGDFSSWRVSDSDAANFVAAFRRWANLARQVIPGCRIVWSPNDGTSSMTRVDAAWPYADVVDFIGVDSYNMWPHRTDASAIRTSFNLWDGNGNPVGIEAWRQYAQSKGVPMYLSETGNSANPSFEGGGGDAPAYFTELHSWAVAHAGNGPGQVYAAIFFNFGQQDGYGADFQFFVPGTGADPSQPGFAAAFKAAPLVGGQPNPDPDPDPEPTTGYPAKEIAVYKMMWSSNGPDVGTINSGANVIRIAFANGSGTTPQIVGWGAQGLTSFKSQAADMRARGVKFVLSYGGGGQPVNFSDVNAFVAGVEAIRSQLGFLDGLDWDAESGWNHSQVLAISAALRAKYGSDFAITMAPNGSNISQYLTTAVALHQAGNLTSFGQQFYDAPVSVDAAAGRIQQAIDAGIPIEKYAVGMMIGSSSNYWTNAQCKANMIELMRRFPGLRRCYLWEANRAGTSQWVNDMVSVLGVTPDPGPGPNPGTVAWPLRRASAGKYLEDQAGRAFLYTADTGWMFASRLTEADARKYIDIKADQGFSAIQTSLTVWARDRAGDKGSPFVGANMTQPNESYWAAVDRIIDYAATKGMVLVLWPIWAASNGGWDATLGAPSASEFSSYCTWLGNRYSSRGNIMWALGGDEQWGQVSSWMEAGATALEAADPNHLKTYHPRWDNYAETSWKSWLDFNTVQKNDNTGPPFMHHLARTGFEHSSGKPFLNGEPPYYPSTAVGGVNTSIHRNRVNHWASMLSGSLGVTYGGSRTGTWNIGADGVYDWAMTAHVTGRHVGNIRRILGPLAWHKLIPDFSGSVVTGGRGTYDSTGWAPAGRASDGSLIVCYAPNGGTLTVDMTKLSGSGIARWYDPTTAAVAGTQVSVSNTGSRSFAPPSSSNADGNPDWVLVISTN